LLVQSSSFQHFCSSYKLIAFFVGPTRLHWLLSYPSLILLDLPLRFYRFFLSQYARPNCVIFHLQNLREDWYLLSITRFALLSSLLFSRYLNLSIQNLVAQQVVYYAPKVFISILFLLVSWSCWFGATSISPNHLGDAD
jgi:hypothetical protein